MSKAKCLSCETQFTVVPIRVKTVCKNGDVVSHEIPNHSKYCPACKKSKGNLPPVGAYGITVAEFNAINTKQNGLCAMCGRPPKTKWLFIDHDHKTGKVRGLLCNRCNTGLGMFEDNPATLRAGADYLERHNSLCC